MRYQTDLNQSEIINPVNINNVSIPKINGVNGHASPHHVNMSPGKMGSSISKFDIIKNGGASSHNQSVL